jgi:hypothetical protein
LGSIGVHPKIMMTVRVLANGTSLENLTVHKTNYSAVDEKSEVAWKLLKQMVGHSAPSYIKQHGFVVPLSRLAPRLLG